MSKNQKEEKRVERVAFKMRLKPGFEADYRKNHDEIWPGLTRVLKEAGISDYSIFLDRETLTLFAVHRLAGENSAADLADLPIVRMWWEHTASTVDTQPDGTPVCIPLEEVFHLD